jgi:hypothetical protein
MRLRNTKIPGKMVNKDGEPGHRCGSRFCPHELLVPLGASRRTPRPRSTEDAHPSRILTMRNVTTPTGVWPYVEGITHKASKPTATAANPPGGQDDPRSESQHAERHGEDITRWTGPGNRRYPPQKGANVGQVSRPQSAATIANEGVS